MPHSHMKLFHLVPTLPSPPSNLHSMFSVLTSAIADGGANAILFPPNYPNVSNYVHKPSRAAMADGNSSLLIFGTANYGPFPVSIANVQRPIWSECSLVLHPNNLSIYKRARGMFIVDESCNPSKLVTTASLTEYDNLYHLDNIEDFLDFNPSTPLHPPISAAINLIHQDTENTTDREFRLGSQRHHYRAQVGELNPLEHLHVLLNHQSEDLIKHIVRNKLLRGLRYTYSDIRRLHLKLCDTCMKARMQAFPVYSSVPDRATQPMEIISVDILDFSSRPDVNGLCYVAIYGDRFSGCVFVYYMKRKHELLTTLTKFETEHGTPRNPRAIQVRFINADSGAEQLSIDFISYCDKHNIQLHLAPPKKPQYNYIESLVNGVKIGTATALHYQQAPFIYWTYAMTYHCWTYRCLPRMGERQARITLFNGTTPDLSHCAPFYSQGFSNITKAERDSNILPPKAIACRLLGYANNINSRDSPQLHHDAPGGVVSYKQSYIIRLDSSAIIVRHDCYFGHYATDNPLQRKMLNDIPRTDQDATDIDTLLRPTESRILTSLRIRHHNIDSELSSEENERELMTTNDPQRRRISSYNSPTNPEHAALEPRKNVTGSTCSSSGILDNSTHSDSHQTGYDSSTTFEPTLITDNSSSSRPVRIRRPSVTLRQVDNTGPSNRPVSFYATSVANVPHWYPPTAVSNVRVRPFQQLDFPTIENVASTEPPTADWVDRDPIEPLPTTARDALQGQDTLYWKSGMLRETTKVLARRAWEYYSLQEQHHRLKKAVRSKYVFKHKKRAEDSWTRYKARLTAKGFTQTFGHNYTDTYAPTARFDTVCILLFLACIFNWDLDGLDVENAFIEGDLDTDIDMVLPEDVFRNIDGSPVVVRLLKAIYGLKQASHVFHKKLTDALKTLGLTPTAHDPCLFVLQDHDLNLLTLVIMWVDDIVVTGNDRNMISIIHKALSAVFQKVTYEGEIQRYIGINIFRDRINRTMLINQSHYVQSMTNQHLPPDPKLKLNPVNPLNDLKTKGNGDLPDIFQQTGELGYLADRTYPQIKYPMGQLRSAASNPTEQHNKALRHLYRYLANDPESGLTFSRGSSDDVFLFAVCDGSKIRGDDSHGQSAYALFLNLSSGTVSACSLRNSRITTSPAEEELCAVVSTIKRIIWCRGLLTEISFPQTEPTPLFTDNTAVIAMTTNEQNTVQNEHMTMAINYVRQQIAAKVVVLYHVDGDKNAADVMTKNLAKPKFIPLTKTLTSGHNGSLPQSSAGCKPVSRPNPFTKMNANKRKAQRQRHPKFNNPTEEDTDSE